MGDKSVRVEILDSGDVYHRQFDAPHEAGQYDVAIGDIVVLAEDWIFFKKGPIDPGALAVMQEREYDYAPAFVPGSIRVISRSTLVQLASANAEVDEDTPCESNAILEVAQYYVTPLELFEGMVGRGAAIVTFPLAETESEITLSIVGFLTRSDMNKKALRTRIYEMLLDLETALAELIESVHLVEDEWIAILPDEAKAKVLGYRALTRLKGVNASAIAATNLSDLFKIAAKSDLVREALGYPRRKYAESVINRINGLRNTIMHPVRPLVLSDDNVVEIRDALRSVAELLQRLKELRKLAMSRGKDGV